MNAKLLKVLTHPLRVPIATGLASFGTGIGLGYILGRRNKEEEPEVHDAPPQLIFDFDAEDLGELRAEDIYRKTKGPEEESNDPDAVVQNFIDGKLKEPVSVVEEVVEEVVEGEEIVVDVEEIETTNIFAGSDDDWDYDKEQANRNDREPYILHKDEFFADEKGYTQSTLTYYAGDDILVDQEEKPIYNYSQVVGSLQFGHGSGDPNVFHVRNDKNKAEYEILKDSGLYSVEVLGLEIEDNQRVRDIKHSNTPRKFHMD